MGGATAPNTGSGACPAWMHFVSADQLALSSWWLMESLRTAECRSRSISERGRSGKELERLRIAHCELRIAHCELRIANLEGTAEGGCAGRDFPFHLMT